MKVTRYARENCGKPRACVPASKRRSFIIILHAPTYLLVSPLHDKIGTSVDRDANEWKVRPGNT